MVPLSTLLSIVTLQPCASAAPRTSVKPRPQPLRPEVRASRVLAKGLKRLDCSSAAITEPTIVHRYVGTRSGSLHAYCDRLLAIAILHRVDRKVPECAAQFVGVPNAADPASLPENEPVSVHYGQFFMTSRAIPARSHSCFSDKCRATGPTHLPAASGGPSFKGSHFFAITEQGGDFRGNRFP